MGKRMSIAAKERWRKRKALMEASQNEADGPNHSAVTTDIEQSKHSQSAAFTSKRKILKVNDMIVRRSNRLKSLGSFGKRRGTEAVQHIDLTNCDRDKEPHVEPISLKPTRDVSNLEMKADGPKSAVLTNNAQRKLSQAVPSKRKKTSKASDMLVRQSGQLKSLGSSGKRQREGVHHIDPTDCDKDMELQVETISPKPIRDGSSSETIVDNLVQTRGRRPFASETTPTNHNYKIRYTNSEKKVEALTEENYQQAQKLSYLLGKVKILVATVMKYENMTGIVMNLSRGAVKLHPDAAALNSSPAPKPSPVKKKKNSVKRMKKN
ncbi:hypothetical protein RND71_022987 [Anisodus tanguticus]|uniref:Uncharacterized protein n=1 Tax=Anisodus tanguticus TaxID=243964 RepID=A0AAE1RUP2_9SOLA|nr:hypothetical protein RND71_022987 [Anisodus tanguticus]